MPCYHPLACYMQRGGGITFDHSDSNGIDASVACGQCFGCRLERSRIWAARCMHEASLYEDNCFITLTYDDVHLPYGGTLVKHHFVDFIKRLRGRVFPLKFRYYMCGEYGDENGRPHYHAILFGFRFPDAVLQGNREGYPIFCSELLGEVWEHGFHEIGSVSFESCAYVARYIMKKVNGRNADAHYATDIYLGDYLFFRTPEYSTMSRGGNVKGSHGIGYDWFRKYSEDCMNFDELPVPGKGMCGLVPRYYLDVYETEHPGEVAELKAARREFFLAHYLDCTRERLMEREVVKRASLSFCSRSL